MLNRRKSSLGTIVCCIGLVAMSWGCDASGRSAQQPEAEETQVPPAKTAVPEDGPAQAQSEPVKFPGIYAIWPNKYTTHVQKLPYVKGGQIAVQWGELHTGQDRYNWSSLDTLLAAAAKENRIVSLQINGNIKPAFLFDIVPYTTNWGEEQVRDSRGVLMYWHPAFIKAYTGFLAQLADHLNRSPYRSFVLGLRQNFNAIGTEKLPVPENKQPLSAWTIPAGDQEATAWTRDIQLDYQRKVLASFVSGFATGIERPIPVFIRNNLSPELAAPYVAEFAAGHLNWFHTSSEIEPRGASVAKQYETFLSYSRAGQTLGYAEQWAGAWGDHGGKVDPRWYPPPAWNYWRLLSDLNMGVSYIGVYSDDLQVALDGFHRGENAGEEYRRQFDAAFRFAAKYAGHHSDPEHSPGAWVAFRESDTDLKPSLYNNNVTDYTMHMILLNPQDTDGLDARKDGIAAPLVQKQTIKGLYSIGPYYQRFGAWARKLPAGNTMQLKLDEKFARSLDGSKAAINVTYYDHAEGTSFTLQSSGVSQTIALSGTGKWMKASVPVNQAAFANNGSVALITVSAIGSDVIFHMVEVTRDAE